MHNVAYRRGSRKTNIITLLQLLVEEAFIFIRKAGILAHFKKKKKLSQYRAKLAISFQIFTASLCIIIKKPNKRHVKDE